MVTETESRMESLRVQLDRARQTALNERVHQEPAPSRCACAACKSQACTHAQGTRLAWPSGELRTALHAACDMLQVRLEADADVVREREQVAALHAEVRRRSRFLVALVRAARHAQVRDLKAKLHTAQHESAKLADTDTQRQIARLKADHADELAQLRALHENALAAVRPPWWPDCRRRDQRVLVSTATAHGGHRYRFV